MSAAPPFQVTHNQAMRLYSYIQTYRLYAFAALLPSTERNSLLRVLQTVQGKLIGAQEQVTVQRSLTILLTREEAIALKKAATELLTLYATQPESPERTAMLGDLASLKTCLHKTFEDM